MNSKGVKRCTCLVIAVWLVAAAADAVEPSRAFEPVSCVPVEGITTTDGRLTINVDDVEVAQLLRMLSVKRRVSIIVGPDVAGTISVNLYDVTFDEALQSILDSSGLTATRRGSVILVTDIPGKAGLPIDTAEMDLRVFKLDYSDPDEIFALVSEFISPAGKAVVSSEETMMLVQDTVPYLERVTALVEQLDVPPKQVLIEARLLEIRYEDNLTVGVQVSAQDIRGDTLLQALTSGFAADVTMVPQGNQGLFAGVVSEDASAFVEALAEKVEIKTLANPKILAVDNQQAEIIIGDRLGFKITTTTETSSLESVEFLDVGTQLRLTPHIGDDRLVLLEIHPEVSSGSVSALGLPSESTAEATTHMLVKDGQTIVLGGLLNETTSDQVAKVPVLGDIPILGYLFRRTTKRDTQSELVVLITPHIVGPEPDDEMKKVINETAQMSRTNEADCAEEAYEVAPNYQPAESRTTCARYTEDSSSSPIEQVSAEPSGSGLSRAGARPQVQPAGTATPSGSSTHRETRYCIEILATRNEKVADRCVRTLGESGIFAWVEPPDKNAGRRHSRVVTGLFSTWTEAEQSLENMKQRTELADAFIRPVI